MPSARSVDEAGVLEQLEVPGDRGPADRQLVGELPDGLIAGAEQLDDRPAVRVTEGVEGITGQPSSGIAQP